jgi:hypothetical protein
MEYENLNLNNSEWEVYHNSDGMLVPIMDEYPSPENTFDVWSNNTGAGAGNGDKLDPEAVASAVTTITAVGSQLLANRDSTKQELRNRCGRKPLLRKNRVGEDGYDKCRETFYKELQGGGFKSQEQNDFIPPPPPPPKGLSTGAKIGIALGIVALGVGAYFLLRKK